MTRDEFLDWAERQNERYEFDGFQPVAMFGPVGMTGGTQNHIQIALNIYVALRTRLSGTSCKALGLEAGVATIGDTIRYPDALVTCTPGPGTARLIPGVLAVFEVVSPSSERIDRIDKLREYGAVPSIRRYAIVEQATIGLTVFERAEGVEDWTAFALMADETLRMPEIGIEIPVRELYAGTDVE